MLGHAVEAVGQGAQFIAGGTFHPRIKISFLNFFNGLFQLSHRFQHEQVAGVEQHAGPHQYRCQHAHLQQVQQRCPLGNVDLDAVDKVIDVGRKGHCVGAQVVITCGFGQNPACLISGPVALDHGKALIGVGVPRHKQRAIRIALAQGGQAAVEFGALVWKLAGFPGANGKRHAVRLHAHASGLVDGCGTAVQLPRDPQGGNGGHEDQEQEWRPHHQQFGTQAPVALDGHDCAALAVEAGLTSEKIERETDFMCSVCRMTEVCHETANGIKRP